MSKRESLYHKYPDYRVDTEPNPQRIRARIGETLIADSEHTLIVRETNLEPVVYFPRADVELELAEKTDHQSFCPFKGEASYWSFRSDGSVEENVAWSYEDPFDEVAPLGGYIAFYPGRVEISNEGG